MPTQLPSRSPSPVRGVYGENALEAGFRSYLHAVYAYMTGGLALTGIVAWYAVSTGIYQKIAATPLIWVVLFAPFVMVLVLGFRLQKMSLPAARVTYWAYAALMGLSIAGIFLMYTGEAISRVFFITAGTFGVMSVYGYTTKRSLANWGSFLMMGLIGVIIASVVNLFLHSTRLQMMVSVIGVIVFVGLTAYDTQRIKLAYSGTDGSDVLGKKVVMGALMLYLDFVNLFIMLLQLFGGRR
ncbi:MAG: Bax inhibitor-1/YccA family protein [Nevskiaceae bacterium]|nr:MAG: Bax inhibitor-1/YccA family protein [Nevskiaceae bacterium]TBR72211.1 MAG: Bax inhibitor-1/YccA family protein [Nevskiaceae bacterium]